jgi:hypothetical protein
VDSYKAPQHRGYTAKTRGRNSGALYPPAAAGSLPPRPRLLWE